MPRAMIFIDGTWLWRNLKRLSGEYGEQYKINYSQIRPLVKERLQELLEGAEVDIVRVNLFGSYPVNCAKEDELIARARYEFYIDRKKYDQFEIELFEIDFKGQPLRRRIVEIEEESEEEEIEESIVEDEKEEEVIEKKKSRWERPKEKCVDIALATSMLYYAAIPYAYDIAVPIVGDIDYWPVFKRVRHLGKRIMIVSIRGSCAKPFWLPTDPLGIRDFPTMFLNDYLDRLQLKEERRQYIYCKKWFLTPYKGDKPICPDYMSQLYQKRKGE